MQEQCLSMPSMKTAGSLLRKASSTILSEKAEAKERYAPTASGKPVRTKKRKRIVFSRANPAKTNQLTGAEEQKFNHRYMIERNFKGKSRYAYICFNRKFSSSSSFMRRNSWLVHAGYRVGYNCFYDITSYSYTSNNMLME